MNVPRRKCTAGWMATRKTCLAATQVTKQNSTGIPEAPLNLLFRPSERILWRMPSSAQHYLRFICVLQWSDSPFISTAAWQVSASEVFLKRSPMCRLHCICSTSGRFCPKQQSWVVVTQTIWYSKCQKCTVEPFPEGVCRPLLCDSPSEWCSVIHPFRWGWTRCRFWFGTQWCHMGILVCGFQCAFVGTDVGWVASSGFTGWWTCSRPPSVNSTKWLCQFLAPSSDGTRPPLCILSTLHV